MSWKTSMRSLAFGLSLALIFAIPFENVLDIPPFGTVARTVGLAVMAFWMLTVVATGRLRRPTPFLGVAFLFVLWYALSAVWSIDAARTLEVSQTYVQLFALLYVIWDLYTTPRHVALGFQAYILGCYVSIFSLIQNYQAGITEASRRYTATGFNSNDLAMGLSLALPLAWYLLVSPQGRPLGSRLTSRLLRLLNMAYLPVGLFAILLTASRAGFFGAILIFPLMALTLPRVRLQRAVIGLSLALAAGGLVLSWAPETSFERLAGTGSEIRGGNWNTRGPIWRESIVSIANHPLLGVGGGTHRQAARVTQKVAHNFVLGLGVEVGLVGLALFCLPLAVAALEVRKLPRWDQRMWLVLFGMWLLNNLTHNWEDSKQTWLFLAWAVVSANAARQGVASPAVRTVQAAVPLHTSAYTDS